MIDNMILSSPLNIQPLTPVKVNFIYVYHYSYMSTINSNIPSNVWDRERLKENKKFINILQKYTILSYAL